MAHLRINPAAILALGVIALAGCSPPRSPPPDDAPPSTSAPIALGLMTSLPMYWPEGAGLADLAAGRGAVPWQRQVIETRYAIAPLDTLSPIAALPSDTGELDPLNGLTRLAVIQPRGLSPDDNVALDHWVRNGGRLLLLLDPALTGEYEAPLGDPRRPVDSALIPPVVARWGLAVRFDETQELTLVNAVLDGVQLPLALPGQITITDPAAADCTLHAQTAAAVCRVGKGRVTVIADAALFEHPELAGKNGARLHAVLAASLN